VRSEEWRPVAGFPGYQVSDYGRVFSSHSGMTLKPQRTKAALQVFLRHNGMTFQRRVHRLVLEAFVGECPPGMECRHLDGDWTNNVLGNLAWGTPKENMSDAFRHYAERSGEI
jgi:hypothetical protein